MIETYAVENRLNAEIERCLRTGTKRGPLVITPDEYQLLRDGGLINSGMFQSDYFYMPLEVTP